MQLASPPPTRRSTEVDLDAYFARIGYSGTRLPTLATLCTLIELHLAAIPFEAIDVQLGRGIDLLPAAVDAKLIHARRGGYCFEHNSLMWRVLSALGFEVERLVARVRWMQPADASPTPRTHMILKVRVDEVDWLVDVGFGGCVPASPLNLRSHAVQRTTHESYRLRSGPHGHRLEALLDGLWSPVYEFTEEPQTDADYVQYNWYTSTFPQSHFRHTLIAALTTRDARYTLRDARLSVRATDGTLTRTELDADGIEQVLAETFGLTVDASWRPLLERAAERQSSGV